MPSAAMSPCLVCWLPARRPRPRLSRLYAPESPRPCAKIKVAVGAAPDAGGTTIVLRSDEAGMIVVLVDTTTVSRCPLRSTHTAIEAAQAERSRRRLVDQLRRDAFWIRIGI